MSAPAGGGPEYVRPRSPRSTQARSGATGACSAGTPLSADDPAAQHRHLAKSLAPRHASDGAVEAGPLVGLDVDEEDRRGRSRRMLCSTRARRSCPAISAIGDQHGQAEAQRQHDAGRSDCPAGAGWRGPAASPDCAACRRGRAAQATPDAGEAEQASSVSERAADEPRARTSSRCAVRDRERCRAPRRRAAQPPDRSPRGAAATPGRRRRGTAPPAGTSRGARRAARARRRARSAGRRRRRCARPPG